MSTSRRIDGGIVARFLSPGTSTLASHSATAASAELIGMRPREVCTLAFPQFSQR